MGQSVAVRIENAVTIDDGMSGIGKQQDSGMGSVVGNLLYYYYISGICPQFLHPKS